MSEIMLKIVCLLGEKTLRFVSFVENYYVVLEKQTKF